MGSRHDLVELQGFDAIRDARRLAEERAGLLTCDGDVDLIGVGARSEPAARAEEGAEQPVGRAILQVVLLDGFSVVIGGGSRW
jgi:hypothetical protein